MPRHTACRPRPTRNTAQLLVTAQTSVPTRKKTPRTSSVRFLPHRSEALPASAIVAAPTTPRMVSAQLVLLPEAGKAAPIFGMSTPIIAYWKGTISEKMTSAIKMTSRRPFDAPSRRPAFSSSVTVACGAEACAMGTSSMKRSRVCEVGHMIIPVCRKRSLTLLIPCDVGRVRPVELP